MATKKVSGDAFEKYDVGAIIAVVALAILILISVELLFGFSIDQLANGDIIIVAIEVLAVVLLLTKVKKEA